MPLSLDYNKKQINKAIVAAELEDEYISLPIEMLESFGAEVMEVYEKLLDRKIIYAQRGCC